MSALLILLATVASAQAPVQLEIATDSRRFSCSQPGSGTILGSMVEIRPRGFVLDQCLPTQDCQKVIPATFSVAAPGFSGFQRLLKRDGFVRVQFDIRKTGAVCEDRIMVTALGNWLGAPNPSGDGDRFYFAGGTNTTATFQDSPFTVERCLGGKPGLRMRPRALPAHDAAPGESLWTVSDRERWTVSVLTSGSCASNAGWVYWVAGISN